MHVRFRSILGVLLCVGSSVCITRADNGADSSRNDERSAPQATVSQNVLIVPGRCHSHGCWWWRILAVEADGQKAGGTLLKVTVSTTEAEYTQEEIDAHGYPEAPARFADWDPPEEIFAFCSKTSPAIIEQDVSGRAFSATVPFRRDGSVAGTHEDLANLYRRVCEDPSGDFDMPAGREGKRVTLAHPREILSGFPH